MFTTAHSPDIAKKTRLPHGPAVGLRLHLRLQELYWQYCAVLALSGIWLVSTGNAPVFTAQTRFGTDHERQVSAATDFPLPLATNRVMLRGTGL